MSLKMEIVYVKGTQDLVILGKRCSKMRFSIIVSVTFDIENALLFYVG